MTWIFVDCEGAKVGTELREFGAVEYKTHKSFYGPNNSFDTFKAFAEWLDQFQGRPIFISDNVAYDWQSINYFFWHHLGYNPFGHSGRRIGDFYAGLCGDFSKTQEWKRLRVTPHDHNPVHDALGNAEAFKRLLDGER